MNAYDCNYENGLVRCMLLDVGLPSAFVIASHLFRRNNHYLAEPFLNLQDIDDIRNGLLLFKPLEKEFDRFNISFIYNSQRDAFEFKLYNPDLKFVPLIKLLDFKDSLDLMKNTPLPQDWENSPTEILLSGTLFDVRTTFGQLEGRALVFKNLNRPFKRCLNLQARLARNEAIKKKWIDPKDDFEDFWSEGESLSDKMERFNLSQLWK